MPPLKISKKHHKHFNNPFPSPPKSLPLIHGTLSHNNTLPCRRVYPIGEDFRLLWSSDNGGYLSVSHSSHPDRSLWSTIPGQAFISAAAVKSEAEESRGSFAMKDGDIKSICRSQTIDEIDTVFSSEIDEARVINHLPIDLLRGLNFPVLVIHGGVSSKKSSFNARFWMLFHQKNSHQIEFQVKLGVLKQEPCASLEGFHSQQWKKSDRHRRRPCFLSCFSGRKDFLGLSSDDEREEEEKVGGSEEVSRVFLTYSSEKDEKIFGFGEQFSHMEFKGRRVPILVQEQGIGRGDQPITFAANLISYSVAIVERRVEAGGQRRGRREAAGKWRKTQAKGSKGSCGQVEKDPGGAGSTQGKQRDWHGGHPWSATIRRILNGCSPVELIERYTETIGRPPVLPNWIITGAIIGMQGGTKYVRNIWSQLKDHDVPVSAFWLQDWVGRRKTILGSQLWWNWEVDTTHYAGWRELVDDLRINNIRVMAYCNPCVVPVTKEKPNKNKDLFEEAKRLDILVKDNNGSIYMIPNTAFNVGMLDLTHPNASSWFKKILHDMVDCGVSGWMADFGEGLPLDANIFSGEDPMIAHNRYPELWARVNREFVEEWKFNGRGKERGDDEESLVFFMRAGFRESPKWVMLFWEGDQMVSWQQNDGIKSSVTGLLSGGLSGFAFNHSDIGGYCGIDFPLINYRRSEELLMRWMELNAFNTIYRTHEGNKPESNCQFYSNRKTFSHFSRFAKVYKAWKFYRVQLIKEASENGLPIARHLFLHYPDDGHIHSLTYQQFLVGTEILVVPVLDKGKKKVKAYFPMGRENCSWQHLWTGKLFRGSLGNSEKMRRGMEAWVEAPIGYPAIFVKAGSPVGKQFMKNLQDFGIL
ncbi:putative alpha-xylosidase 2 [Platanthera zijinensis]|uniref:Alpha-xylosidase 2 n=1 Tax=Platanthera zijinensis TaxID=2320716 RepID=A0AAP0BL67_9ASPA